MKTKNLITGLLMGMILILVFTGYVNAICEEEINEYERLEKAYNESGSGIKEIEVLSAYWGTANCYKSAGDHKKAIEMCGESLKWGLKGIEVNCKHKERE